MRSYSSYFAVALGIARVAMGQSQTDLISVVSKVAELSTFSALLTSNPELVSSVIPSGSSGVTVLAPNNAAFAKYANFSTTGSLTGDNLITVLKYHVMAANMTTQNFTSPQGVMVPTMLRDEAHNNRTAGAALQAQYGNLASQGQVIYAALESPGSGKVRIMRQATPKFVPLTGGNSQGAQMSLSDLQWSGGYIQIIDTVLIPPTMCSDTVRASDKLNALDNALNRTDLWTTVNHINNVTCLGPSNNAFSAAGSPDSNLDTAKLTDALLNHTVAMPLYSPYLEDGMVIPSMGKMKITVSIRGNDIYFNDAKVIQPNVMTNNGIIHVLDKVMSDNVIAAAPSSTVTTTSTQTAKPTSTSNAASLPTGNAPGGLLAFVAAAVMVL